MMETARLRKGVLVLWNDDKGFGFVRPESGGEDYFVHISAFHKGISRRPETGDTVHYQLAYEIPDRKRIAYAFLEGVAVVPPQSESAVRWAKAYAVVRYVLVRLPILLSIWALWQTHNPIPLFLYVFMSALTILYYGVDKKRALAGRWRIPEVYMHLLELFGGWPGALLAQKDFRHKVTKSSYQQVFWGIVALHGLVWAVALGFGFSLRRIVAALSDGIQFLIGGT